MKRTYEILLEKHLKEYRQMIFLSGPRQVGKTTTSIEASSESPLHYYFNWDNKDRRALLINGPESIAQAVRLDIMQSSQPVSLIYLWNWALIEDRGARYENFTASHLYKAVQFWTDSGLGEYALYYLRDKDKREVDFLVTKDRKPWFLVESKVSGNQAISKSLYYYQEQLKVPHAFQIGFDLPFVNQDCFKLKEPTIVSAKTLLSQLV